MRVYLLGKPQETVDEVCSSFDSIAAFAEKHGGLRKGDLVVFEVDDSFFVWRTVTDNPSRPYVYTSDPNVQGIDFFVTFLKKEEGEVAGVSFNKDGKPTLESFNLDTDSVVGVGSLSTFEHPDGWRSAIFKRNEDWCAWMGGPKRPVVALSKGEATIYRHVSGTFGVKAVKILPEGSFDFGIRLPWWPVGVSYKGTEGSANPKMVVEAFLKEFEEELPESFRIQYTPPGGGRGDLEVWCGRNPSTGNWFQRWNTEILPEGSWLHRCRDGQTRLALRDGNTVRFQDLPDEEAPWEGGHPGTTDLGSRPIKYTAGTSSSLPEGGLEIGGIKLVEVSWVSDPPYGEFFRGVCETKDPETIERIASSLEVPIRDQHVPKENLSGSSERFEEFHLRVKDDIIASFAMREKDIAVDLEAGGFPDRQKAKMSNFGVPSIINPLTRRVVANTEVGRRTFLVDPLPESHLLRYITVAEPSSKRVLKKVLTHAGLSALGREGFRLSHVVTALAGHALAARGGHISMASSCEMLLSYTLEKGGAALIEELANTFRGWEGREIVELCDAIEIEEIHSAP